MSTRPTDSEIAEFLDKEAIRIQKDARYYGGASANPHIDPRPGNLIEIGPSCIITEYKRPPENPDEAP